MKSTTRRSGFTLIEILIVLGIIAAVAAIFIPVVLNMSDRNQVPKGASMLENALSLAKARAVSEKRPNGIRLVLASSTLRTTSGNAGFAWYDEIQYIEDPSDYTEHWVWGIADSGTVDIVQPWWSIRRGAGTIGPAAPSPGSLPWGLDTVSVSAVSFTYAAFTTSNATTTVTTARARNRLLFSPITNADWKGNGPYPMAYINPLTTLPDNVLATDTYRSQRLQFGYSGTTPFPVQVGDKVELTGTGEVYGVASVSTGAVLISAPNTAQVSIIELDRPLSSNIQPSLNGRPNYRVIRQPRAISSLLPVKLPQDVVIDLTGSRAVGNTDSSGSIFMSNVSTGISTSPISGITTAVANNVAPEYVDIMFSAAGEVMPTTQDFRPTATQVGSFSVGQSGLIALWLHQRGDPNLWAAQKITAAQGNADNQAIVSINARTGFIGSYPMTPLSVSTDPLSYARIGKARMSADTGP